MINFPNKKAIGPVVTTVLLLVVAVVAVVGFNTWFTQYSSTTFVNVEQKSEKGNVLSVQGLIGDTLYLKSDNELNLSLLKVTDKNGVKMCGFDSSVEVNSSGLVGWWDLNQNDSGANGITDMSGNGNDGTVTSATFKNGANCYPFEDGCYEFDGVDDVIIISNEANFDFEKNEPFSMKMWFKTDSSAIQTLIGKGFNTIGLSGYLILATPTNLNVYLTNTWSSNAITKSMGMSYNDGDWHYIATTYDGSSTNAGLKLYIDGVNIDNGGLDTLTGTILNNEPLRIGNRGGTGPSPFNGSIDDVKIYNRALSANEIEQSYWSAIIHKETGINKIDLSICNLIKGDEYNILAFSNNNQIDYNLIAK